MSLERIIITLTPEGSIRGISSTDYDGLPVPLNAKQLSDLVPGLNSAALARITEIESEHALTLSGVEDEKSAAVEEAIALKVAENLGALAEKQAAIDAKEEELRVAKLPEEEKRKEDIRRQIAELQAKLEP